MGFQPLVCLFILFADDVFQTENVWALIGTYLLSLLLDALFILLYLLVMIKTIKMSFTMPTFYIWKYFLFIDIDEGISSHSGASLKLFME
jgi:hypothetical protein